MADARTQLADAPDPIRAVARQIAERFHPRKVILFGSHAWGRPSPDSDADLLVIMDTNDNPLHAAGMISAAVDHLLPLDILVMTPARWEAYLKEGAIFATRVAMGGRVLYEAGDGGVD
jgi:predicted nucleotidyltransferase